LPGDPRRRNSAPTDDLDNTVRTGHFAAGKGHWKEEGKTKERERDGGKGHKKGKGSPYSITERRVQEPIPVLGSQPTGDVSHKPGGRLPLPSARLAVTSATLKRTATNFAA